MGDEVPPTFRPWLRPCIAAVAENNHDLQLIVDNIPTESIEMGMQINIEKTEVQHVR